MLAPPTASISRSSFAIMLAVALDEIFNKIMGEAI